jgi:hypothetical protein
MILIMLGGLIVIAIVSRGPMSTVIRGSTPVTDSPHDMGPHLSLLTRMVREGDRPSDWLVSFAVSEAWESGDYELAERIANAFHATPSLAPPAPSDTVETPTVSAPNAFKKQSPLDGVKDDDWTDFVNSLAVDSPDFDTDQHRGVFHHSKRRLTQLGIDPSTLSDPESQYSALEKDITDCNSRFGKMLRERVTELIQIDGTEHVVTQSGMLALLKTAGNKGAEKWLADAEDRKKYPKTTETFLRANGIF